MNHTTIGIVFGSFQPLHAGHISTILQAKHYCDKVFVVACGYNDDIRDKKYDLPQQKRFRLIKQFFKDDEIVDVISINDSDYGLDKIAFTEEGWKKWFNIVCEKVIGKKPEWASDYSLRFYVGEEKYQKDMEKYLKTTPCPVNIELVDRKILPISGTMIRENPVKYWNNIAQTFRGEFSSNILITGTASEGKTNLVQDIAKRFNIPYSVEGARDIVRKNGKAGFDMDLTTKDFLEFLVHQYNINREMIDGPQNSRGVTIADSDNMITLTYAKAYSRLGNKISKSDYEFLKSAAKQLTKGIKWDAIFVTHPAEKAIVDDGERFQGQASYEERMENFDVLMKLIKEFYPNTPVVMLSSNYDTNYNTVEAYIANLLGD